MWEKEGFLNKEGEGRNEKRREENERGRVGHKGNGGRRGWWQLGHSILLKKRTQAEDTGKVE